MVKVVFTTSHLFHVICSSEWFVLSGVRFMVICCLQRVRLRLMTVVTYSGRRRAVVAVDRARTATALGSRPALRPTRRRTAAAPVVAPVAAAAAAAAAVAPAAPAAPAAAAAALTPRTSGVPPTRAVASPQQRGPLVRARTTAAHADATATR